MDKEELEARYLIVEKLTRLFKLERVVHLIVTSISLIMLLLSAATLILKGNAGEVELSLMFGSSGLITYTAGRLLKMWNQALKIIVGEKGGEDEK